MASTSPIAGKWVVLWRFDRYVSLMEDGVETSYFDSEDEAREVADEAQSNHCPFPYVLVELP